MNISPITAGLGEDSGQGKSSEVLSLATPSATEDGFVALLAVLKEILAWDDRLMSGHGIPLRLRDDADAIIARTTGV